MENSERKNLGTIFSEVLENSEFSTLSSQIGNFHVLTHHKNHHHGGLSGMDLQIRNVIDSSDHIIKIADRLECLGYGVFPLVIRIPEVHQKIIKIPDSYDS